MDIIDQLNRFFTWFKRKILKQRIPSKQQKVPVKAMDFGKNYSQSITAVSNAPNTNGRIYCNALTLPEIQSFAILCIKLSPTVQDSRPFRKELIGVCKKQDIEGFLIVRAGSRMEKIECLPEEGFEQRTFWMESATTNDLLELEYIEDLGSKSETNIEKKL